MKKQLLLLSTLFISTLSACNTAPMPMTTAPMPMLLQTQASTRVIYHVVPDSAAKVWHIKRQNNPQPVATFATKAEAVAAGRVLGRSHALGQLIVHKANGQIEIEYTYGKDPKQIHG